jgi:hypothetical protein
VEKLQEFSDARAGREKTRFARRTRSIFNTAAIVLGLLIAYLQIKHIKPDLLLTTSSADIVWRVALVAYYWSWVGGANFDTNIQELAYASFPGHGRWPLQSYAVLTILVLMGAVLLVTYENIAHFSLALTGFLLADYASWFYLRRFLRQSVDDSQAAYSAGSRFYELEILKLVRDYIFGQWKLWRLMVGAILRDHCGRICLQPGLSGSDGKCRTDRLSVAVARRRHLPFLLGVFSALCARDGIVALAESAASVPSRAGSGISQRALFLDAPTECARVARIVDRGRAHPVGRISEA